MKSSGFWAGLLFGFILGAGCGAYYGFHVFYDSVNLKRIEANFTKVEPGMRSGDALVALFDGVLLFPENASTSGTLKLPVWGYSSKDMVDCRFRGRGSSPFTIYLDTKNDTVVKAQREHNTRFD